MDNKIAAVTMRNITKRFGPTLANDRVWLIFTGGRSWPCWARTAAARPPS